MTDFDALRARALGTLQRLAGSTWTDHNTHDPGITLLEQLCYALTDLAYRSAYAVPDLLAELPAATGGAASAGVFNPAQVLPSSPVTLDDLRRTVIDLPGVKNAWIEPLDEPLARHDAAQALLGAVPPAGAGVDASAATPSPNVSDLRPRGLYRVRIEKSGLGEDVDGGLLVRQAAQRLQQWRGLGEDIADISVLDRSPVALDAALELAAGADAAEVLASVYQALAQYMSPALPLRSLRELLDRGQRVDQVFEGPLLTRGYIDPAEWAAAGRRTALRVSDLIRELMAVPGVQAVKSLGFLRDGVVSSDWLLSVAADRSASFDLASSRLRLERGGLRIDHAAMRDSARRLFEARVRRSAQAVAEGGAEHELAPPAGRWRDVGRYLSVQHHLPPVYGVGPSGLSSHEPVERHAQARQLKAYLLIFDQLLANQFAQLAQAARLLSFDDDSASVSFARAVPDEGGQLHFDHVRRQPPDVHAPWLERITQDPWGDDALGERALAQRHRLVDHLLARLGEHWGEQRPVPDDDADADALSIAPASVAPASVDMAADPAADAATAAAATTAAPAEPDAGTGAAPDSAAGAAVEAVEAVDATRTDPGAAPSAAEAPLSVRARALRDKQAYLRDYPRLALRRGVGENALLGPDEVAEPAGLAQRLSRLLGWDPAASRLAVVEHILLRPLPGDAWQQGPLMRGVTAHDPFSLQLSLVLPAQDARLADTDLRQRVQRLVVDEAPAHLSVRLLWLDDAALAAFEAARVRWQALWRSARRQRFGLDGSTLPTGADDHQIALRSARNRVIDALGLGDTCPLTDLTVADGGANGPIKVAHGRSARITIDDAEAGVRYELRGPEGKPLRDDEGKELPPVAAEGADGRLVLESPPVHDDIAYRILATKLRPAPGLPQQPAVLLAQAAPVKVGLDTRLVIGLPDLPLLDATLANPQPGDARLCDFGARVRVQVQASQEGVAYALVIDGQVLKPPVIGDLDTIELLTPPLAEDSTLAVQATKTFSGGAGGAAEQQLLDARLRVAVRVDPSPALQPLPAALIDHAQGTAVLRLATSQAGVRYRLWVRRVRDAEWLRDVPPGEDTASWLRASPDGPAVRPPERPEAPLPPAGFTPVGDEALPGTGAALDLPLGAPADDIVCLVQASKQHAAGDASIDTELLLAAAALVLVRPDAAPALQLALVQPAPGVAPQLRVSGGQPGVTYHFQPLTDAPAEAVALPWPAYFHQRDDADAALNKGLGQLAIGIDAVVAPDGEPDAAVPGDTADGAPDALEPDRRRPAPPLLDLPALPDGTLLALRAIKAQTGAEQALAARAHLLAAPQARLAPDFPAAGAAAVVQVADSAADLRYQLWLAGQPLADAVPGNGGLLELPTGALGTDVRLALRVDPAPAGDDEGAEPALPLHHEQVLAVRLLPRADLPLSLRHPVLAAGDSAEIVVADSQPGVLYQLRTGGQPVGAAMAGNGDEAVLVTGPILADTAFTVTASRADVPEAGVVMAGEVTVALPVADPPA